MAGKKKKDKKKEKKENLTEQIPPVDRQFYEITINDLTNKLTRLRSHSSKLEEQNEEFETKIKQIEEDKADITAYLNRTLNEKLETIVELEDKLSELHKVREEENTDAQNKLKEWERKYMAMDDQLTSEIKLLNGKLNSLEEFRIQRDELMAKFDEQTAKMKEEQRKHKETFDEIEQKTIQDKNSLRKEVEKKLTELSNEFNRTREIRVAAHTQRLVRENIALQNEMDAMTQTQLQLQIKCDKMLAMDEEMKRQVLVDYSERKQLVRTSAKQIQIIERMTRDFERLKKKNVELIAIKKQFDINLIELQMTKKETIELRAKVGILDRRLDMVDQNRKSLKIETQQAKMELGKIYNVVKTLRQTVKSAIGTQPLVSTQREHLLLSLLNILTGIDDCKMATTVDISEPKGLIYKLGSIGFVPQSSQMKALMKKRSSEKLDPIQLPEKNVADTQATVESPTQPMRKKWGSDPIIDVDQEQAEVQEVAADGDGDHGADGDESKAHDELKKQQSTSGKRDEESDEDNGDDDLEIRAGDSPIDYEMHLF